MFKWTLFFVLCNFSPAILANIVPEETKYKPVQKQKVFYQESKNREDELVPPQTGISSQREKLRLPKEEFPVPFRASVQQKPRSRNPYSSVSAQRRADQGPVLQNGYPSQPAGILEEDIDILAAQGGSPPTETVPLYECPDSYRATPDGDGTTFQIYDSGRWWTHNCQSGLVWDQTLCRCEYPPGTRWELDCRDFRSVPGDEAPNSFQQFVNGAWVTRDCSPSVAGLVWDQDSCRCVWGPGGPESVAASSPCDIMLNMTFDHGVEDTAKRSFVEVGQGLPLPTRSDPQQGTRRGGNRAAYFTDTALNIWYFSDNDMGSSLRLEFRFLQDNVARSPSVGARTMDNSVYQMFLSNGCNISSAGYMPPAVAIGYRASDHSYLLAFETSAVRKAIVCSRPTAPNRWHSLSLLYEDGTLVMRVDGQPCVVSADFSGPIQKSPCPLTIGADPLDRQGVYRGYLDDLLIARNCRYPSETNTEDPLRQNAEDPVPYRAKFLEDRHRSRPEPHILSRNHLSDEKSYLSESAVKIDRENENDTMQSNMKKKLMNETDSFGSSEPLEKQHPYGAVDLASQKDRNMSSDLEAAGEDMKLVEKVTSIATTRGPMSLDKSTAAANLEFSNATIGDNTYGENETELHSIRTALENVNSLISSTSTENSTKQTNNTNINSVKEAITAKASTILGSRPKISLFRDGVNGETNQWQRLDGLSKDRDRGENFSSDETAASLSTRKEVLGGLATDNAHDLGEAKELHNQSVSNRKATDDSSSAYTEINSDISRDEKGLPVKAVQPRRDRRHINQKQTETIKTRPELYSNIKDQSFHGPMWYEYVRGTHPLTFFKGEDEEGRVRYSYKKRQTEKSNPKPLRPNERNMFYSKERFVRKSNHPSMTNRRDRRKRVPVIVIKRWYDKPPQH